MLEQTLKAIRDYPAEAYEKAIEYTLMNLI
jgi:hypothetical protein